MTRPDEIRPAHRVPAREEGSATLELALLTPVLLAFLLLMVAMGRFAGTRADVDAAARDAARAASAARSAPRARAVAEDAASATLRAGGVDCRSLTVDVELAKFAPGGTVAARVSCSVDLTDVSLLRLPGSRILTARFVSPVDVYREG